jgi:Ca2+-binding RTX toxin-like protein
MTTILVQAGTNAAALQNIIDSAPEGARIVLEEGTYRFTQTLEIDRNGITLEGQGNVTIIADASLNGEPAIQIGAPLYSEVADDPVRVTSNASEGGRALSLQTGHGVQVGDTIWVEQPNDEALFAQIGDTQWRGDKPLRTGLAVVTAVNGNSVSLDRGLPFDFAANLTTVEVTHMVHDVTVKGITLRGDFGTSTASDFNNPLATEQGGMMLVVNASIGTHLTDIDIIEPGSNGVVLGRSMDAVITDVSVTGAHNKGEGGNGYAFWLRDITDCSFTDLRAVDTRHAVLFASYTSATGNDVHVSFTNRDINFHGGLDHGNTVVVDNSVRTVDEQRYMGAVSFVNPGTNYGAPTDPNANSITFRNVVGTVRPDLVVGQNGGVTISTLGGNDTLTGGAGSDLLDAGTGNDWIMASRGFDVVLGGAGNDTFVFGFERDQAIVQTVGLKTVITTALGVTSLTDVEAIKFTSGTVSTAVAGTATLHGALGYDRTDISNTMIADDLVNAATMVGNRNIGFLGNALANNVIGNIGNNVILGEGGNDRLFGGAGQDYLDGGTGNDYLHGGAGNDTLFGAAGDDTLSGRQGADVFVASEGRNIVDDFSIAQGDTVAFRGYATADLITSLADYLAGQSLSTDDFTISTEVLNGKPTLVILSDAGDSLALQNIQAADLYTYLLA